MAFDNFTKHWKFYLFNLKLYFVFYDLTLSHSLYVLGKPLGTQFTVEY